MIFVIDTSGSMQSDNWENAQNVMKEILDIYPKLKGVQVIDDNGKKGDANQRVITAAEWWDEFNRYVYYHDEPNANPSAVSLMLSFRTMLDPKRAEGIDAARGRVDLARYGWGAAVGDLDQLLWSGE